MSLLQTSVITSRPVWVQVDPTDTSGSSFGCGSGDCRRIYGMEMR
jgi:arabinogalactan endo-1,4-beta-galactosidase